jgi:hypothetical protein
VIPGPGGPQAGTDALIRQVDRRLAAVRVAGPHEAMLAERLAATLRALVAATAGSSAADRARVRAAVHRFTRDFARDARYGRRPARPIAADLDVVNRIARDLGREDLLVEYDGLAV